MSSVAERLDRNRLALLLAFSVLFFWTVTRRAAAKPFWHDEIYTILVSRLPGFMAIWSATAEGIDCMPPLNAMATRAVHLLFGEGHVVTRLPSMAGVWLMCVCVFYFVRRRSDTLSAFLAILLTLATPALRYSYEARGYGLMLGLCGVSLLCWQCAAEGRQRRLALTGLALSLAASLVNHYYSGLVLAAIGTAEVARTLFRRRLDGGMWLALSAPLLSGLILWPLVRGALAYAPATTSRPQASGVAFSYVFLLQPLLIPAVAVLILLALLQLRPGQKDAETPRRESVPAHEIVALVMLAAIPLLGTLGAMAAGLPGVERYWMPAVVGFGVLLAWSADRASLGRPWVGTILLLVLGARFVAQAAGAVGLSAQNPDPLAAHRLVRGDKPVPLVLADAELFLEWVYYSPDSVSGLYYVSDPAWERRSTGADTIDRNLEILRRYVPLTVVNWEPFTRANRQFSLYRTDVPAWLIPRLLELGARLELADKDPNGELYRVRLP